VFSSGAVKVSLRNRGNRRRINHDTIIYKTLNISKSDSVVASKQTCDVQQTFFYKSRGEYISEHREGESGELTGKGVPKRAARSLKHIIKIHNIARLLDAWKIECLRRVFYAICNKD
jgi:hypothetical protein